MKDAKSDNRFREIGELVGDAMADLRDRPLRCFIDEGSIGFRDGAGYDIPLTKCDTYEKIIAWQLQLSTKQWMTLDLLMQFTLIACDHHELPIAKI